MSQRFNGPRARRRRYELGLTVSQLADAIGASKSYVSQIENGAFDPGPARFAALVKALGIKDTQEMWTQEGDAA